MNLLAACSLIGLLITGAREQEIPIYTEKGSYIGLKSTKDLLPGRIVECQVGLGLVQLQNGTWVDPIDLRLPSEERK